MIRMFQVKNQDALRRLLKAGAQGDVTGSPAFERLQKLNPHVDFTKITPGTVVLLPDSRDIDSTQGHSVAGEAFDGLASDALSGLKGATARMRDGLARREAERKEIEAVLKGATFRRLIETDDELRKQVAAASERFKADQKEASESLAQLVAGGKALSDELAALGKLFK